MANEKRLIDANALLEDFGEEPMVWNDGEAEIQERSDWHKYRVLVKLQPTVDAVEVVHGRWVQVICHEEFEDGFVDRVKECCSVCHAPNGRRMSNYCPNCGAKMYGS